MNKYKRIICTEEQHQSLKMLSAKNKQKIQEVVSDAITQYLQNNNVEVKNEN